MYLKLAWRNIWRSGRRTAITISSIFFAVVFAILMRVMVVGLFDNMIANTVSLSCGYLQIHHAGYWDSKSIDSSFAENASLTQFLDHDKEITAWAPRLESFALASSGERTKGILVVGIDPRKENAVSNLMGKLTQGHYLQDSSKSILLGQGLAAYLHLHLNDTIILLGQGYQGNMAAGKYVIGGIIKLAVPDMNKTMAWLPMSRARDFLSTGARYTSVSLMVKDRDQLLQLQRRVIAATKSSGYEVMTWKEMVPELDQLFQAKMAQNEIMSGVLYLVIAFGIFGTIVMMVNERMHEFGILIAIGMRKGILSAIVVTELLLMSVVGTLLGMAGAFPIVGYYRLHPIHMGGTWGAEAEQFNFEPVIQPSMAISNFMIQGYIVLMMSITLSLYAIFKIYKMKAIAAINS